jgi:hypothetical protein
MAASASAPGSAKRQARGGAASASGNAVSAPDSLARVSPAGLFEFGGRLVSFFFLTVNGGERIPT